jgi:hypothetical protein
MARGISNNIFPAEHNLFSDSICIFQLGENILFFPPVSLFFSLLGHAINSFTFTGCVLCLCFSPLAMLFGI